ncbi:MAG: hypothetical protein ACRCSK_08065 [Fusobacteriaceae bacterium]
MYLFLVVLFVITCIIIFINLKKFLDKKIIIYYNEKSNLYEQNFYESKKSRENKNQNIIAAEKIKNSDIENFEESEEIIFTVENFSEENFTEENFTEENFTEENFSDENLILNVEDEKILNENFENNSKRKNLKSEKTKSCCFCNFFCKFYWLWIIALIIVVAILYRYSSDRLLNFLGASVGGIISLVGIRWQISRGEKKQWLGLLKLIDGTIDQNLAKFPKSEIEKNIIYFVLGDKQRILDDRDTKFYLLDEINFADKQKLHANNLEEFLYLQESVKSFTHSLMSLKKKQHFYFTNIEEFDSFKNISQKTKNYIKFVLNFTNCCQVVASGIPVENNSFIQEHNEKICEFFEPMNDMKAIEDFLTFDIPEYTEDGKLFTARLYEQGRKLFEPIMESEKYLEYRLFYYLVLLADKLRDNSEVPEKMKEKIIMLITDSMNIYFLVCGGEKVLAENIPDILKTYQIKLRKEIRRLERFI